MYETTSLGGDEGFTSVSSSTGASEFDRDLLLLKESPLFTTPKTKQQNVLKYHFKIYGHFENTKNKAIDYFFFSKFYNFYFSLTNVEINVMYKC